MMMRGRRRNFFIFQGDDIIVTTKLGEVRIVDFDYFEDNNERIEKDNEDLYHP